MGRKPEVVSVEQTKISPDLTFGVEFEFASPMEQYDTAVALTEVGLETEDEDYNHEDCYYWKIVEDSSVYGEGFYPMELVSPPMRGREGLAELERACLALQAIDCEVNPSCGLHVHHDARMLDDDAWKLLLKSVLKYEDTIDAMMGPDRVNNNYAKRMRRYGVSVPEMFRRVDEAWDVWDLHRIWYSRFQKLNIEALEVHGTVEFRQHGGTLDFCDVAAWVSFTQGLVLRAASHRKMRLRATERPFESLMWTAGACPAVKRHFAQKYAPLY
jgi:hypothetical protein